MEIFKLAPVYKNYIWGGNKLKNIWNKNSNLDIIAESWELSTHNDGRSKISNDKYFSKTLDEVLTSEICGQNCTPFIRFPILIKLIDSNQKLSIQVHPNDEYSIKNENDLGKTEMWYIADCEKNSGIYLGFNRDVSRAEVEKEIENNNIEKYLNFIPVKKGDSFLIEAGTIHAIGSGITICEIQQNSNITYRVYDYGRVDASGNKRELQIQKALDVLNYKKHLIKDDNSNILAKCKYFTVLKYTITDELNLHCDNYSFNAISIMEGNGFIENISFVKGDTFFVPANYGKYIIKGNVEILLTKV